jgi:hypothetical protein
MAGRLTGNFAQSRVPTTSESMNDMFKTFNKSRQDLMANEIAGEDRLLREKALLQQQSNADRTYAIQEANAARQAQQNEYNMQIKAAEIGATSDRDISTAAHQAQVLANQAAATKATDIYRTGQQRFQQEGRNYDRGIEAGEIQGSSMPINETTMQPGTVTVPTAGGKQIKEEEFARLAGMVGNTVEGKEGMYLEYLKKVDPVAYAAEVKQGSIVDEITSGDSVDKLRNLPKNMLTSPYDVAKMITDATVMPAVEAGWKAVTDKRSLSEKAIQTEKTPLKEGVQTREQYMKDIAANEEKAKADIAKFLKTDKPYAKVIGAMEDKVTSVAKRVDESKLRSTASQDIINYAAQNNLKANDPKVLGMQKVMNARIEKVVATRMAADVESVARVYKQLDAQQKHQFDIDLLNMKQAFEGIMTPEEEANMTLTLAKAAT